MTLSPVLNPRSTRKCPEPSWVLAASLALVDTAAGQARIGQKTAAFTRRTPVATTSFTLHDATPALGATPLMAAATSVDLAAGEVRIRAALPGSGLPASRVTIMSTAQLTGTFAVRLDFLHGMAATIDALGDAAGAVLTTCRLTAGLWTAVQGCEATVTTAGRLSGQLFPGSVVVSPY